MAKLIVLEGLDGSGKATQTNLLAKKLESEGKRVRIIDFPAYGTEGAVLVQMYLDGKLGSSPSDTNAYAASMFFAADRYVSYINDWRKDYCDENCIIVANRYTTANAYHQLSKMDESEWDAFLNWLYDFEFVKLGLPVPDGVIFLDMPERVSSALVRKRSVSEGRAMDIHEKDNGYLQACRKAAAYAADRWKWVKVACAGENDDIPYRQEKIAEEVYSTATKLINS